MMIVASLEIPVDFSEAAEAAETVIQGARRAQELPLAVREQIERMAQEDSPVALFEAVEEAPGISVTASPELRALVGNLRARGIA